jgi:hypothetical protein
LARCYRKKRHKGENTLYEVVEDAATSCSIEGSSNVKFLIARGRNINKSRIEQINEEWRTGIHIILITITHETIQILVWFSGGILAILVVLNNLS